MVSSALDAWLRIKPKAQTTSVHSTPSSSAPGVQRARAAYVGLKPISKVTAVLEFVATRPRELGAETDLNWDHSEASGRGPSLPQGYSVLSSFRGLLRVKVSNWRYAKCS